MSDIHQTFSICQDWPPKLIINAQRMDMHMQLRAVIKQ